MRLREMLAAGFAAGCGALACARSAERDVVPSARPLAAMIDEHGDPFTGPIRLAELRDGRVLAYDAREGRLARIDFAARTEVPVSRRGAGPLEHRSALAVVAAPSDSVWLFDLQQGRVLVFSPEGEPVRSFDNTAGLGGRARISAPWLVAVAADGSWYGRARGMSVLGARSAFAESLAVVRVSRGGAPPGASNPASDGARHDTLAMLRPEGAGNRTSEARFRLTSFDPFDAFGVFGDGRVIVVRGEDYSVEIVDTDGAVRAAGRVVHQRVTLTPDAIREVADSSNRLMSGLLAMSMANMPRRPGEAPPSVEYVLPDPAPASWPVVMEELLPVDGRDRAWVAVRDSLTATGGQRYDLLDREGRWTGAVRIPPRHALVAFGRDVVYVARRDADDLLWLGRYPLPD